MSHGSEIFLFEAVLKIRSANKLFSVMNNADQPLHLWQTDLASLPERKIQEIFHASNNNCITVRPICQGENQLEFHFNILFPVYIQFCIFDFENAT